ncbi:hypothetical protein GNI_035510 [Gregarina niphandrodes]|uniref:DnaJ domain protein n=1 Tax=Gregarina niphandrodes TaxID=110365 RepID=A0A023BAQ9_GRENI|nr:hypothetical protein GNI_035510 [Gregarina niphandrodes]EZG78495.1 hypothetical protein GNI_035510 [Gregarina niphandrodes]|eukprot:XP_011129279.1 hypothetical protein GNI_035510 [Gregarina niphandrodes]
MSLPELMKLMDRHFERYNNNCRSEQARRERAQAVALAKEEERRLEANHRLKKIVPILDYLASTEALAQAQQQKIKSKTLDPCIILGIPYDSVNKTVLKKIKLKVQASLHPDKYNLDWLESEKRAEWTARISHAFRLVTEALNELQKCESLTPRWVMCRGLVEPPYAEEVGIQWKGSKHTPVKVPVIKPPGSAPPSAQQPESEEPKAHGGGSAAANTSRKAVITPLLFRTTPLTALAEGPPLPQGGKSRKSRDAFLEPMCQLTFPDKVWVRQGVLELDVCLKEESLKDDLQEGIRRSTEHRCLVLWVAAPRLKNVRVPFKSRVIAKYIFTLTWATASRRSATLHLDGLPLIGNHDTCYYEFQWVETVDLSGGALPLRDLAIRQTEPVRVVRPVLVPALREGGVNMYRATLNVLWQLSDVYGEPLKQFYADMRTNGGPPWIKTLKRHEARQLLESVFTDLQPHLLTDN